MWKCDKCDECQSEPVIQAGENAFAWLYGIQIFVIAMIDHEGFCD